MASQKWRHLPLFHRNKRDPASLASWPDLHRLLSSECGAVDLMFTATDSAFFAIWVALAVKVAFYVTRSLSHQEKSLCQIMILIDALWQLWAVLDLGLQWVGTVWVGFWLGVWLGGFDRCPSWTCQVSCLRSPSSTPTLRKRATISH